MYFSEVVRANGHRRQQPNRNTYSDHQFVWGLFGRDDDIRDFIYTVHEDKIYVVSTRVQNYKNSAIQVRTKPYEPSFKEGNPLRFDVRFDGETRIGNDRKSIVNSYKERLGEDHDLNRNELMHEAVGDWFRRNSRNYGFKVRDYHIRGYHHYDFVKTKKSINPRNKNEKVKFDSLDIRGVLEVTGPAVFVNTLHRGIGKARGYGCGLILVAR